jgi:curved DNA-binding protein CbpA
MSITRRILDSAQSGLSRLTSLVIVDDEPLTHVESAALQAELTARKAAREKAPRAPADNPVAKHAVASPAARAVRERNARDRAQRIHRERDERDARQKAAADDAFRRMKEQAARGGGATTRPSGGAASTGSARSPRAGSTDAQLADWFRTLDVSPGAELSEIKSAYRRMMRKYHPDMHAGNPQRQKAANEMSMRVTTAYNGLVAHFDKK